ncbi:unnamed protein product [Rangifer tarandus platyrhynchus]|uniref:Uncharacterized protein n=1 Tax=Rangifer tarandus platyrhynchus TaxID=3082113 RepID=A0ABN8YCJ8_RANTA|nr:unnamed protein product [Rangifer tarandus platyrhynchus]
MHAEHLLRTPTSQLCVLKNKKGSSKITRKWRLESEGFKKRRVKKGTGVMTWLNRAARQEGNGSVGSGKSICQGRGSLGHHLQPRENPSRLPHYCPRSEREDESRRATDGIEFACNEGDLGWIPGLGRSPGEGNGNLLQHSCLETWTEEPGGLQFKTHRVGHD